MMRVSKGKSFRRSNLILWTAAALSTSSVPGYAFTRPGLNPMKPMMTPFQPSSHQPIRPIQTRYFATKNDGFLGKVKSAAKSILPSSWFQSEEEKKAAIERKKYEKEISGGLAEVLKDAPLPIKMMGKLVGPMMSSMMSGLAETMAEQQQTVDNIMREARNYIENDPQVLSSLGDPVAVSAPFSQSSSTSSINGKTTTRVQLAFQVSGSRGSGMAQLVADDSGVRAIELQAQGRVIRVDTSSSNTTARRFKNTEKNDDIIEAEIIEKDTKN